MLTKSEDHLSNQIAIGSILPLLNVRVHIEKQKHMETNIQHIKLINDYIKNSLSKEARVDFESKL